MKSTISPIKELPFKEEWRDKNICIEGYRQTEKYFKEYRNEILYALDFPYTKKEGYVGIHCRFGDWGDAWYIRKTLL